MSCVHSRVGRSPPFGSELPRSGLVPPLPLQRLRRFSPLDTLQVCCALHPAMGFAVFPLRSRWPLARRLRTGRSASPTALCPSELSPSQQVAARHRVSMPSRRCSWVPAWFLPCCHGWRSKPSAVRSTSGFYSAAKYVALADVAIGESLVAPLGFVPGASAMPVFPDRVPKVAVACAPEGAGWFVSRPEGRGALHGIRRLVALPEGKARPPPGRWPVGVEPMPRRDRSRLRPTAGRPRRAGWPVGSRRRPKAGSRPAPWLRGSRRPRPPWVGLGGRPKAPALAFRAAPESSAGAIPARRGSASARCAPARRSVEFGCTSGSRRSRRTVPRAPGGARGASRGPRAPEGAYRRGCHHPPGGGWCRPPEGGRRLGCRLWPRRAKVSMGSRTPKGPFVQGGPWVPTQESEDPRVRRTLEQARASASSPEGGGSARPGASGGGLRRVPRLPRAARVQAISSASFFVCLRRRPARLVCGTPRWPKPAVLPRADPSASSAEALGQPPKRWRGSRVCRVQGRRRMVGAGAPIPRAEARGRRGVGTRRYRWCRGP
jgi:hypothetical protein